MPVFAPVKKRNTLFRNLNITFKNHIENKIKRITKIEAIIGLVTIKYNIPTTKESSVTLATEFVTGSGEVLIATRVVALVR